MGSLSASSGSASTAFNASALLPAISRVRPQYACAPQRACLEIGYPRHSLPQAIEPLAVLAHLRENLAAGQLTLAPQTLAELDGIAAAAVAAKH
jgi:hypothetical protein